MNQQASMKSKVLNNTNLSASSSTKKVQRSRFVVPNSTKSQSLPGVAIADLTSTDLKLQYGVSLNVDDP